jgi:hypothetical protein
MNDPIWSKIQHRKDALPDQTVQLFTNVPGSYRGMLSISRGHSRFARIFCRAIGLPKASADTPFLLNIFEEDGGLVWERRQNGKTYRTRRWAEDGNVFLSAGAGVMRLKPRVRHSDVVLRNDEMKVHGVRLSKSWFPHASAIHSVNEDGQMTFDITLELAWDTLLIRFFGWMERIEDQRQSPEKEDNAPWALESAL